MSYTLEYGKDERGRYWRDRPLAYLRDNDPDYSDAVYLKTKWPRAFDLVRSVYYDESQYVGGPEDKANYEYWKENYSATEGKSWWDLGHTDGILVRIPLLAKDEKESYEYLNVEEGFELDEDRTQTIRNEIEMEAWNDFGAKDYKDAILEGVYDDQEKEVVEELLDAITDGGFAAASFDMWSRLQHYPESSGWEVTFPDPKTSFVADENFTDYSVEGVINWLGIGHEVTIRLSPRAFCRLDESEKDVGYSGAQYFRYGEEWILNVTFDEIVNYPVEMVSGRGAPYNYDAIEQLLAMHMDGNAQYIGFDQAPSVKAMFNSQMCRNPYLLCDIDYIEEHKLEILAGPKAEWDSKLAETDEEAAKKKYEADLILQRLHSDMVASVRNLTIEGALEVCNVDPTSDLVERVVELVLLDAPERSPATLAYPDTQRHLKEVACEYTRKALDQRPQVCTLRQLKLPMARERRKKKRA